MRSSEFASVAYANCISTAGAPNASEGVKGIAQLATQIQMASSTNLGSSGASLVLQSQYATSSPGSAGIWAVITNNAGKIAQSFLDFSQLWVFSNASSTQLSALTNFYSEGTSKFVGTVTMSATTTLAGCVGCLSGIETKTSTGSGPTATGAGGTTTATCTSGKRVIGGGGQISTVASAPVVGSSYPDTSSTWSVIPYCSFAGGGGSCNASTVTAYVICAYP